MSTAHSRLAGRDAEGRGASEFRPKMGPTGRKAMPRRAPARSKAGARALVALLVIATLWAAAATWFAVSNRATALRLADEQQDLRLAYDDKVKALTRRLVGVASHQMLEQDGLSGRLADIISRQVELENRQSTLSLLADRLGSTGALGASSGPAPAVSRGKAEDDNPAVGSRTRAIPAEPPARSPAASPEPPTLRLGAPAARDPAPGSGGLGPRSALEPRPSTTPVARGGRLNGLKDLPLRDQFAALEGSITQIERGQTRVLGSFSAGIQNGVSLIRTSLAELGVQVPAPEKPAEPARGRTLRLSGRPAPPVDTFETRLASLTEEFGHFERWRTVVDAVPLRRPVEGDHNLTSNFGSRKDPFTGAGAMHAGMDFRGPIGTPIRAAGGGRVITADVTGGYGNLVEVDHGNGIVTRYGHLSAFNVSSGQSVTAGTVVGLLGSTGRSTGPHLHYETRINGSAVDPMRFLRTGAHLFDQPAPLELGQGGDIGEEASFD